MLRLFDARSGIPQTPPPMRLDRFFSWKTLACLACALTPLSLTAAESAAVESAAAPANPEVRSLALQDCVRQALEHNLKIQIGRYDPLRVEYQLSGTYGMYDPTFQTKAEQSQYSSQGRFDPTTGTITLNSENNSDAFDASFAGTLPSGLTYSLGGNLGHDKGINPQGPYDNYDANANLSLTLPVLRGFMTDRIQIQMAKKNLEISEAGFEDSVRQVVLAVHLAYYELIYARELVKVQEKALELATNLVAQNREKVRVGVLAPLDEKQAEAQAAANLADVWAARRAVAYRENVLKDLITDRYESWYRVSIQPGESLVAVPQMYDMVDSWSTALTKRPDFKQVRQQLELRGLDTKLSRNHLLPSLGVFGGYGRSGFDNSISNTREAAPGPALEDIRYGRYPGHNFGAILSVPLSMTKERSAYKGSKAAEKQAELVLQQTKQQILVEVDNAISQAQINFQRVSATHEARLFAEAALDAEQKKLDNGKSTSFEVLRLQRDLTSARGDEIRALADYNEALASLYAAEGSILDRNKISVSYK